MAHTRIWLTLVATAGLMAAAPRAAHAQEPRASVAGGVVYLQQNTTGELAAPTFPLGWLGTSAFKLAGRVSGVGEFGISYQTNDFDERLQLMGLLGGARFELYRARRISLFAQGLIGLERFSEPGLAESGLAVQPGGGIDFYLSSTVFIRGQGDYRWSQAGDATFHAFRVVAGVGVTIR